MFKNNYSKEITGLQEVITEKITENSDNIEIYIRNRKKAQHCPCCGRRTVHIYDYREQRIKDVSFRGKNAILILRKRRFVCPHCKKRFYEKNTWLPKYSRRTMRLTETIILKLKDLVSYSHVAKECNLSITTVQRVFNVVSYFPKQLPKVLLIDEFKGNTGGQKYQCILMDGLTGEVVDILPDREKATLYRYFKNKNPENVQLLVSDMWKPYYELCLEIFKNAKHITDKYHVIRQATWAMDAVRKECQKELNKQSRTRFKRMAELLRTARSKLKDEDIPKVSEILSCSKPLANAYWLKEDFYKIFHTRDRLDAAERLQEWCENAESSGFKRFVDCSKTMFKWQKSILNSIEYGYTNGRIEGMNNKIKVLKRVSFGLRNFSRFRNRIFHTS